MTTRPDAGMIGLGIMGGAIARNLMAGGLSVMGYDPDAAAMARFAENGGLAATRAGDVAAQAPIVLMSLPSIDALHGVTRDICDSGSAGCIVVECGTLPVDDKQKAHDLLAEKSITLLDCPLSGTGAQAVHKDLVVFASGHQDAVAKCQPVFDQMSRETRYVGPFGNGMKMKFVANLLVAIHNVASAEALVLARKAGLDPQMTYDVISSSAATSRMFEIRGPMMVDQTYEPATMKNDVWRKDMELIAAFASDLDCPTPLFSATEGLYSSARGQGMGNLDTAAVSAVLERMAGVPGKD
ncbi:MAG: NAD(P)-dependent oxidoreductase [Hyphomicrobiaceae bacterium]